MSIKTDRVEFLITQEDFIELMDDNDKLCKRVKELEGALKGIGGATVYRKSHEDVTKELEAVRRFARAALAERNE